LVNWAPELLRVQDILLKLPLHLAVEKGQVDNRKKILRKFLEVDVLSPVFITPLKDGVTPAFKFSYN
uniref:ANK_REP_REGION domain-containing protein n=1 Tax=Haemonchus placei TaxID=6290 RepID=A0A0N4VZA1_HAEPC